MRHTQLAVCIAAALAAAPLAATAAQRAYALNGAEIYAGPGQDYPVVARLGPGVGVGVQGCLSDYSWCDVTFAGNRGWVYAGELGYPYQNRRVPIVEFGPQLALPIISFSVGNYWDHYYRGRSWYGQRNEWERHWNDNRQGGSWHGRNDYRDHDRGRNDYRGNDERRNDYRGNDAHRNDYRGNDANRGDNRGTQNRPVENRGGDRRGDVNRGNVQNDGHGGNAARGNQPAAQPKFDNGADHQQ